MLMEQNEKGRDTIWSVVMAVTTVLILLIGIFFLTKLFTANPLEGTWSDTENGMVLHIKSDGVMEVKNKYDHEVLLQDIEHLNMIQHNHSLIAIKNQVGEEKRYLVYYDERWDCKLFLNYKTQNGNNEAALKEQVSVDLNLNSGDITCNYVTSRVQEKYSVSHQETRVYNHRLYEMYFNNIPDEFRKDNFEISGRHYYWMTIDEMEKDDNIKKKNLDVVDFVKEYIK